MSPRTAADAINTIVPGAIVTERQTTHRAAVGNCLNSHAGSSRSKRTRNS